MKRIIIIKAPWKETNDRFHQRSHASKLAIKIIEQIRCSTYYEVVSEQRAALLNQKLEQMQELSSNEINEEYYSFCEEHARNGLDDKYYALTLRAFARLRKKGIPIRYCSINGSTTIEDLAESGIVSVDFGFDTSRFQGNGFYEVCSRYVGFGHRFSGLLPGELKKVVDVVCIEQEVSNHVFFE